MNDSWRGLAVALGMATLLGGCNPTKKALVDRVETIDATIVPPDPESDPPTLLATMTSPLLIGHDRRALFVMTGNVLTSFKRVDKTTAAVTEIPVALAWVAAADDAFVYVAHETPTGGEIVKVPVDKPTAAPTVLAKTGRTAAIAIDGDSLYWLVRDQGLVTIPRGGGKPKTLFDGTDLVWLEITPDEFRVVGEETDRSRIPHYYFAVISRSGAPTKRFEFPGRYVRAIAVRADTWVTVTSDSTMGGLQNHLREYALATGQQKPDQAIFSVRSVATRGPDLFFTECAPDPIEPTTKPGPPSRLSRLDHDGVTHLVTTLYKDSCASDLVIDGDTIYLTTTHGIAKVTTKPH